MIKESGIPSDFVILRHTWYDENDDFGLLLTNRAGTIDYGRQPEIDKNKACYYPSYTTLIDWNGDIFLCPLYVNFESLSLLTNQTFSMEYSNHDRNKLKFHIYSLHQPIFH